MANSEVDVSGEVARAVKLVEGVIEGLGLDPSRLRVEVPGEHSHGWSLMRGSAPVAVFIRAPRENEDSPLLRVVAPIVKIDPASEGALHKRLLELNAHGLGPCAFGVLHDRVVVVAERRTTDLEPAEVGHLIQHVGAVGDHYDDQLIQSFGGTRIGDDG
ncbi:MAG: YbjN domain-containing protein [Polyangiales bacterium]